MTKSNSNNERLKHRYRVWLQDAEGYSEETIDQALAAIESFETFTDSRPFHRFHFEQARAFARDLREQTNPRTGQLYSRATLNGIFGALRKFVDWLADQPDLRIRIAASDARYFRLNEKEARAGRATRPKQVPNLDAMLHVIAQMPVGTDIERRDRAVLAFALLTGARVGAIISAKLKHVDLAERLFFQDGREMKTKRAKTFSTWFFPVGDEIRAIVEQWIEYLRGRGFSDEDPLFPATRLAHDEHHHFVATGLSRQHWQADQPVRDIFRSAFAAADMQPPNPHVVRDMLVQLGMRICSIEEFKAWSQSLGHDHVHTTLASYGTLDADRQRELMRQVGQGNTRLAQGEPDAATVGWVVEHLMNKAS